MQVTLKLTLLAAVTGLALSGCGPEDEDLQDEIAIAEEAVPAVRQIYDPEAAEAAMNQPMDGSSVEAFERDLEQLKSKLTAREFTSVESAIRWMLFYDLSANRDKAKLYASLNGKTPAEIIERAKRSRGQ